jgi:hypothetical protein
MIETRGEMIQDLPVRCYCGDGGDPRRCRVYVSRHGNVFMREIAEHPSNHWSPAEDRRACDRRLPDLFRRRGRCSNWWCAHEFFVFPPTMRPAAGRSVLVGVNTEQPGTPSSNSR